jgi:hypothetical protein
MILLKFLRRRKKKDWSPELVVIDALHSKRRTLTCTEQQLTATWRIFPNNCVDLVFAYFLYLYRLDAKVPVYKESALFPVFSQPGVTFNMKILTSQPVLTTLSE